MEEENIVRSEEVEEEYEEKLRLYEKSKKLDNIIERIENKEIKELLKELIWEIDYLFMWKIENYLKILIV